MHPGTANWRRWHSLHSSWNRQQRKFSCAASPRLLTRQGSAGQLYFYGIAGESDTWASAGEKVRELTPTFSEQVPADGISPAHRLGSFVEKCRPIIVKFASCKTKDKILSQIDKLKGILSQSKPLATRHSRKKLYDFGKATGKQYGMRYN